MLKSTIRLGRGILQGPPGTNEVSDQDKFVLEAIAQMGFRKEDILQVNPSSYDLLEICSELKMFGFSIRYQKLLEENISDSKLPAGINFLRREPKSRKKRIPFFKN
jgi:hypothetical protein